MRQFGLCPVVLLGLLAAAGASGAAPDVAGTWVFRSQGSSDVVTITQAGNDVAFVWSGVAVDGTLSDAGRLQVDGGSVATTVAAIDGDVSADGALLSAGAFVGGVTGFTTPSIFGRRCTCDDGNLTPGDGCDAECQVEPCWTCSGAPSSCVAAGDGAPCSVAACVTGATCSGGVCTGGTPTSPCVDLTGDWWVRATTSLFGMSSVVDHARRIRRSGEYVLVSDFGGTREYFGRIDPGTGAMGWTRLTGLDASGLCGPAQAYREPFTGTATGPDAFTASGVEAVRVTRCPLAADVVEVGTRGTVPTSTTTTSTATTTVTTSTTTTQPDDRTILSPRTLSMRDDVVPPLDPMRRSLVLRVRSSRQATHVVPPPSSGPADPTLHGATLDVWSPVRGEHVRLVLPASGWLDRGARRGFVYRGVGSADPVQRVDIRRDRLTVRLGGAGFRYTLDEPAQGRMAIEVRLGSTVAYCADVPPRLVGSPPSPAMSDRPGRFVGAAGSAVAACAPPP